jgi:hypothetical protein
MTTEVRYFQRILKKSCPGLYDSIGISVTAESNYHQYLGMDGRMRAELNYLKPVKYEITITFPNIGRLYYDMCFFVEFVWSPNNVQATFDYTGNNYFSFII